MFRVPLNQMAALILVSLVVGIITNSIRSDGISFFAKEIEVAEDINDVSGEPVAITLTQAKELFDQGVIFIDARDDEYFADGHIKNAWNSGFFMELMFRLDSLQSRNDPVVVYCSDDECGSSEELAYDLFNEGFNKLMVFQGGWIEWTGIGYPIE
ncbi:MAG: rhodanese-like domain-containing protein [Candidatus Marinimicrobia bacterium]|nr:rhodanese-like domain-containing protein [Candidatus Neomarinimicrobiota bacterium]